LKEKSVVINIYVKNSNNDNEYKVINIMHFEFAKDFKNCIIHPSDLKEALKEFKKYLDVIRDYFTNNKEAEY